MRSFPIVAFRILLVIRGMNRMKRMQEETHAAPAPPLADVLLLTYIRDLLRKFLATRRMADA